MQGTAGAFRQLPRQEPLFLPHQEQVRLQTKFLVGMLQGQSTEDGLQAVIAVYQTTGSRFRNLTLHPGAPAFCIR